ncbi:predicted protein [Naegleria gruberi]|uniref:Predicted protein n=1 Tax=Naegleria gruberi TaxID=5762 RepID=D2VPL2_NAEGR|nr:uncharacterized protein NAEGRDRAFT_51253 [Naegleria gruberi]EFC41142.1 predicted protein [Naegleria gruberi]|eukprot:XP_002673886.1 predicted protein [Naegleria gruberi strain NEG-M]
MKHVLIFGGGNKSNFEEKLVDFFIFNHFETTIPEEWRSDLMNMSTRELMDMSQFSNIENIKNQKLKEFVEACRDLFVSEKITSPTGQQDNKKKKKLKSLEKGLNPKKKYEIERLSKCIRDLSKTSNCNSICDIGGGQGYLSQKILIDQSVENDSNISYIYNIDCNGYLTENAMNRIKMVNSVLDKYHQDEKMHQCSYNAITSHLSFSLNDEEFSQIVNELEGLVATNDDLRMLMIGLHTCGPLASSIIKLFLQSNMCHSLVNVGCCYHKLKEGSSFPLSSHYKNNNKIYMSNLGKSMACINPFNWSHSNMKECNEQFRLKSYRYAFQYLLNSLLGYENSTDLIVRQASKTNSTTFGTFAYHTLQNLFKDYPTISENLPLELTSASVDSFTQKYNEYYQSEFNPNEHDVVKQVEACWFFRSLIGPVIEHYILLDRLLFIHEHSNTMIKKVYLERIFTPSISPRGVVLVAIKKEIDEVDEISTSSI